MPEDTEKTTYRLYAMRRDEQTEAEAKRHRFSRIADYVLVYTAKGVEGIPAAEIAGEDEALLSGADRDWLLACNIVLLAEDAKRREKAISVSLGEKIERLERALEAESKKHSAEETGK